MAFVHEFHGFAQGAEYYGVLAYIIAHTNGMNAYF